MTLGGGRGRSDASENRLAKVERAYLAFTPYHLLLAVALQDRDGSPRAALLFADDAAVMGRAPHLLDALPGSLIPHLLAPLDGIPSWQMPSRRWASARQVRRVLELTDPDLLYVSNGLTAQAVTASRVRDPLCRLEAVEDGLDSYLRVRNAVVAPWRRTLFRAMFRQQHPHTQDITTALPYDAYHLIVPAIARVPAGSVVHGIPEEALRNAARTLRSGFPELAGGAPVTQLRLLNHSTVLPALNVVMGELRDWVDDVRRDPAAVPAVKAHPRERSTKLHAALHTLGVRVLPNWYPVEILGPALAPDVELWCGLTTFIVSSRFLVPGRRVILDASVAPRPADFLRRWDATICQGSAFPTPEETGSSTVTNGRTP